MTGVQTCALPISHVGRFSSMLNMGIVLESVSARDGEVKTVLNNGRIIVNVETKVSMVGKTMP